MASSAGYPGNIKSKYCYCSADHWSAIFYNEQLEVALTRETRGCDSCSALAPAVKTADSRSRIIDRVMHMHLLNDESILYPPLNHFTQICRSFLTPQLITLIEFAAVRRLLQYPSQWCDCSLALICSIILRGAFGYPPECYSPVLGSSY